MCSSNEASELLTRLGTASNAVTGQSLLGNSAQVREDEPGSPLPHHRWDNHTLLLLLIYREVFLSFQYPCPNDILRATFAELKRKKNVFNYLFPKVSALSDCYFFFLFSPSLSLSSFHSTWPWSDGVSLFKHCISSGYPTGKFVWSHHIYRLMGSPCSLLFSAVLSELPGVTRQRDRLCYICRTFCWTAAMVTDVEQKIFGFTVFIFTALLKWL